MKSIFRELDIRNGIIANDQRSMINLKDKTEMRNISTEFLPILEALGRKK